jgi:hypothetical protein
LARKRAEASGHSREKSSAELEDERSLLDGMLTAKQKEEGAVVAKAKLAAKVASSDTAKAKSSAKPRAKSSGTTPAKVRGVVTRTYGNQGITEWIEDSGYLNGFLSS